MGRLSARAVCVALAIAGGLGLTLRGQGADTGLQVQTVGLPAVDEGVIQDESHTPSSVETRRRVALLNALVSDQGGSSATRYRAGRVIVKFRDDAAPLERAAAVRAASASGRIGERPSYADFDLVSIDPSEDAEHAASTLRQRPEVLYAQTAHRRHALHVPNDPQYPLRQWNLPMLNLEKAWDIQPLAGSSIVVAVIDTGMAFANATFTATLPAFIDENGVKYPALGKVTIPYSAAPQLISPTGASRLVAPHDFINNTATPFDFEGHGTHVSGTIGQITDDGIGTAGVAFNVKLMPLKALASTWDVLFGNAPEVGGSDDDIARAIRYAADNGANIINMSLGGSGPPNCGTQPNQADCAPVIEAAMRYAVGKGCFIAVAGGNEFEDTVAPYGTNPTSVIAEIASRIPGAVSVAAVDRSKAHAYYSTTGSYIELSAPGGSERGFSQFADAGYVWQQTFDYNFTDTFLLSPAAYHAPRFDVLAYVGYIGTSMATPHVSGVAAMLMQQGITDPAVIEEILEKTAVDLGAPGRDNTFGFGLVDARAALRGLGLAK